MKRIENERRGESIENMMRDQGLGQDHVLVGDIGKRRIEKRRKQIMNLVQITHLIKIYQRKKCPILCGIGGVIVLQVMTIDWLCITRFYLKCKQYGKQLRSFL